METVEGTTETENRSADADGDSTLTMTKKHWMIRILSELPTFLLPAFVTSLLLTRSLSSCFGSRIMMEDWMIRSFGEFKRHFALRFAVCKTLWRLLASRQSFIIFRAANENQASKSRVAWEFSAHLRPNTQNIKQKKIRRFKTKVEKTFNRTTDRTGRKEKVAQKTSQRSKVMVTQMQW